MIHTLHDLFIGCCIGYTGYSFLRSIFRLLFK
jgi:hypothetical protein